MDSDTRQQIFDFTVMERAERIVDGLATDHDKAVALARWVAAKFRNHSHLEHVHNLHDAPDLFKKFVYRMGSCGTRTQAFVLMAEAVGIKARELALVNFGYVGGAHSTVHVWWDGSWHFFDVTFAGYFERDGEILSFDEVVAYREQSPEWLKPLPTPGLVGYRQRPPDSWVDAEPSESRMRRRYSPQALGVVSHIYAGKRAPTTLRYDLGPGTMIGSRNGHRFDLARDAVKQKVSERLDVLGFWHANFFHYVRLINLTPGRSYTLEYFYYESRWENVDEFFVNGTGCSVVEGSVWRPDAPAGSFRIVIIPDTATCTLDITHSCTTHRRGLFLDQITFFAT